MDRQKQLMRYVKKAKRSLNMEKLFPTLQYGLFFALLFSLAILLVSRYFVFPYYDEIAFTVACGTIVLTFLFFMFTRIRMKDALSVLDSFYPFNELVTALSLKQDNHPLVDSIMEKAVKEVDGAYNRFKKRPKSYWQVKALIGILITSILMAVLILFPSAPQQEAQVVEKEQKIVKEMEKDIKKLEKKVASEDTKRELQELQEKLKKVKTAEEALREVVKKQKELKLQEQKLKEKDLAEGANGLTEEELAMLKELTEMQGSLAKQANNTQAALSKIGKPVNFQLKNTIAKEIGSQSTNSQTQNQGTSQSGQTNQSNSSQGNNNQSQSKQGQGNSSSQNGRKNANQGQCQQGQSCSGSGNGANSSRTSGSATNGGQGGGKGSGAGLGAGDRSLLSVPERIGGSSNPTVDSGPLGDGEHAAEEKGPVPVTKGNVRPYEEVVGEYEKSYMESSERMQLPKDLQEVVESYFTSIQSKE